MVSTGPREKPATVVRDGLSPIVAILLASVSTQTAMHLILPALPIIQTVFGLSDASISLVTTAFVVPGVVLIVPLGMLADRIGRRRVFVGSQITFGLTGLVLMWAHSLGPLLAVRVIQGGCTAAILALSISLIADMRSGRALVSAQGYRVMAMAIGSGVFPIVGVAMLEIRWYAPFALQVIAIPIALYGWRVIPQDRGRSRGQVSVHNLVTASRSVEGRALLFSGFMRFFLKTAFLSYIPILLVGQRGMSIAFTGMVLGLAALAATLAAAATNRLSGMLSALNVMVTGLAGIALSFVMLGVASDATVIVVACIVYGASDSWFGVIQNVMITQAVPAEMRTSFVAVAIGMRSAGKVVALLVIALVVIWFEVSDAFVVIAVIAAASLVTLAPLKHLSEHAHSVEAPLVVGEEVL